ncbi:MAG: hypothetical protein D6809_06490 [Gammaproteobacteria bacterium]|nr:MAG: hypothetical protein D6809_06490 [Gammaproteobacteria bacterium]
MDGDQLLDLSEQRCLAGYVLALLALSRLGPAQRLGLRLRDLRQARWLAARLGRLGYRVGPPAAEAGAALVTVEGRP